MNVAKKLSIRADENRKLILLAKLYPSPPIALLVILLLYIYFLKLCENSNPIK